MNEIVVSGSIEKGMLKLRGREEFERQIRRMSDGEVTVRIEKKKATRSLQANRYYFGVVLRHIAEHTGYDVDEAHEAMKQLFIPKGMAFCDGNGVVQGEVVVGGSTSRMNVNEFHEYVERVRRFAAENLGLEIPDPDPDWYRRGTEAA